MTERLLQFIWQFQYFNKQSLQTTAGEVLDILIQGNFNTHQGPDFLNARVKINSIVFAGNIELHCTSSDWVKHDHTDDEHYKNIVLHVVWKDDLHVRNHCNQLIPTLELQSLVPKVLLERYRQLLQVNAALPCENFLPALSEIGWIKWKETLAIERLMIRSSHIIELYQQSGNHWEETFWWLLAYNFGLKQNAELFQEMAKTISINLLAKHKHQIHQIEALLFGQANLLEDAFEEDYPIMLQKEFRFLQKKYQLKKNNLSTKFLRMRPANFPTIRLAQLASLIMHSSHLFSIVKDCKEVEQVKKYFNVSANDYWNNHFSFDKPSSFKIKFIGEDFADSLIINTVIPVLFAYGHYHQLPLYKDKAIQWLQQLNAEYNAVVDKFSKLNICNKTAFDSQSLLQLNNMYCQQKRCLDCAVGAKILRPTN